MTKIYPEWNDIITGCVKFSKYFAKCYNGKNSLDYIVVLGRGGMIPARIISEYFDAKIVYLSIKSYNGNSEGEIVSSQIPILGENSKVLLVDDCISTGDQMRYVIDRLGVKENNIFIYACYVPWKIPEILSADRLHYSNFFHPRDGDWIIFPWEIK